MNSLFILSLVSLFIIIILILITSKKKNIYDSLKSFNPNIINSNSISSIINPAYLPNIIN